MKRLILAAIPCCLMFIAVTAVFCVQPAQAGYIVTLKKVGSDVIMTGSGAIDLTGLTFDPRVEGCCSAEMSRRKLAPLSLQTGMQFCIAEHPDHQVSGQGNCPLPAALAATQEVWLTSSTLFFLLTM